MSRTLAVFFVAALALLAVVGVGGAVTADQNDQNALNYALQLEYLEADFYAHGVGFGSTEGSLTSASFSAYPSGTYDYFLLIAAHEQAHVDFLSSTLGEGAGSACDSYNFGTAISDADMFVATAKVLENTGVSAYTGAINAITNPDYVEAAATIATIEARHASYLNGLVKTGAAGSMPVPDATTTTDTPLNATQVLAAAGSFFGTCSYDVASNLPIIRPGGVATATTLDHFYASSPQPSTNPAPTYTQAQFDADILVLNFALTLEHLEAAFYNQLATFFTSGAIDAVYTGQGASILSNLALVKAHENAHVSTLTSVINARGGTPVQAGCYDFSAAKASPGAMIGIAQVLENTGVSAYDGAANGITDTGLLQVAATIATIEARHASYLNKVANSTSATSAYGTFPAAFDTAKTKDQILAAVQATGFVVDCGSTGGNGGTGSSSSGGNGGGGGESGNNAASFASPVFATVLAVTAVVFAAFRL